MSEQQGEWVAVIDGDRELVRGSRFDQVNQLAKMLAQSLGLGGHSIAIIFHPHTSIETAFDRCMCSHTRRAHDSAGCSAWIKVYIDHKGILVSAHTCECTLFMGAQRP